MNKRLLVLLTILVMGLALVACGGGAPAAVAPVADAPAAEAPAQEIDLASLPQTVDVDTAYELSQRDDVYMLDVREQYEFDEKHIPEINLLPMSELQSRVSEIPTDKTVIVTCRTGNRSGQVTDFLRASGFDNVHNMDGGIVAWEQAGLPVEQ